MHNRSLLTSFGYALRGLSYAVKTQRNLRIHVGAGCMVLALAGWLQVTVTEWLILCLTVSLVLIAELLNTALEVLVDVASPEHREEAKVIKDVAAAAVLVSCLGAVIVGGVLFLPSLFRR